MTATTVCWMEEARIMLFEECMLSTRARQTREPLSFEKTSWEGDNKRNNVQHVHVVASRLSTRTCDEKQISLSWHWIIFFMQLMFATMSA